MNIFQLALCLSLLTLFEARVIPQESELLVDIPELVKSFHKKIDDDVKAIVSLQGIESNCDEVCESRKKLSKKLKEMEDFTLRL